MKSVINWFEIYTSDLERAKQFYMSVFGFEFTDLTIRNERHSSMQYAIFPGEGGGSGALVRLDVAQPGIGGTAVYFAAQDVDAVLSRVEAAGGKILRAKQDVGEFGSIALIQDTEGNMVGIRSKE